MQKSFGKHILAIDNMLQAGLRQLTPRDLLSGERRQVATTVRVKCTVTDRGRIINLKQV